MNHSALFCLSNCICLLALLLSPASCFDDSPIVPMSEYVAPPGRTSDWRALDCWQCFAAKGRMCHHKRYDASIWMVTQRANRGIGICCKLDATEGYCADDNEDFACSMKSYDPGSIDYGGVLSEGDRNY